MQHVARVDGLDLEEHLLAVAQDRGRSGDHPGQETDLGQGHDQRSNNQPDAVHAAAPSAGAGTFMRFSMRMMAKARTATGMPAARKKPGRAEHVLDESA